MQQESSLLATCPTCWTVHPSDVEALACEQLHDAMLEFDIPQTRIPDPQAQSFIRKFFSKVVPHAPRVAAN